MEFCKRCGKELLETNLIKSVKPETEASKVGLMKGDCIVSIDGKKGEIIEAAESPDCNICILRNGIKKEVEINNLREVLNDITFEYESVCSVCGAKQKGSGKIIIAILILILVLLVSIICLLMKFSNGNSNDKENITNSEGYEIEKNDINSNNLKDNISTEKTVLSDLKVKKLKDLL